MKILHVNTSRSWRGGEQQAFLLYRGLLERGIPGSFVCLPGSVLENKLKEAGMPFHTISFRGEGDILSAWKLARLTQRGVYSILQLHTGHSLSWGLLARLFYPKVRLVFTRRVELPPGRNFISRIRYQTKLLDRIVAVSEGIKQCTVKNGINAGKVIVIQSGVDPNKFSASHGDPELRAKLGIPEDAILVGTSAAFTPEKDYTTLLRAASIACAKDNRLYFLALGEGKLLPEMKALCSELNLDKRFVFAGFQSEIGNYLKALDIFVLNSRNEGTSNALLDAMLCSLPIITTRINGNIDIIKDKVNGLLVSPGDPVETAHAILGLALDREAMSKLGNAALDSVRQYDINITVNKYLELYQSL